MNKPCFVRADWDADASVWVAPSYNVPGLFTEAGTIEVLDAKLENVGPELFELNGCSPKGESVQFEILTSRFSVAKQLIRDSSGVKASRSS